MAFAGYLTATVNFKMNVIIILFITSALDNFRTQKCHASLQSTAVHFSL
jgi:hypothetical protein